MKINKRVQLISSRYSDISFTTAIVASAASMLLTSYAGAASDQTDGAATFYPAPGVLDQQILAYNLVNSQENALSKFYDNGYNYCDAKVLAAFWGEASPTDAKLRLGDKMLRWGPDEAQSFVPTARVQAQRRAEEAGLPCTYEDGDYTWDDVLLLASYWGRTDLDTKYKMASYLVDGLNEDLQSDLQQANKNTTASTQPAAEGLLLAGSGYRLDYSEEAAFEKWAVNDYSYCDAKVLASYWDESSPYDAKLRLGDKMLLNADPWDFVSPAREAALAMPLEDMPCWYADEGFSFDDAKLLASYWKLDSIGDAKYKMTALLIEGKYASIVANLQEARAGVSR